MSTLEERLAHELATVTEERDQLRQEVGGGDIYRHERDALREDLATLTAANEALVVVNQEANEQIVARRAALDAARAGAAVATERFVAAEGRADRYREALEACTSAMRMQVGRETGSLHIPQPTALCIWEEALAKADAALADTSPPAQPAATYPGVTTCETCKCSTWPGANRPAHAPACPHYNTSATGAAAQPVALPPARELAHSGPLGQACTELSTGRESGHTTVCDAVTAMLEADRARRGLDPATVEVEIQKMLADEKLFADVGTWTVNDTAHDGVLQAFVDYMTRSLLSQPRGSR